MNYKTFELSDLEQFMHRVEIKRGNNWNTINPNDPINSLMCPDSIDTQCGYCGRHGALMRGDEVTRNHETKTATFKARCTFESCQQNSVVLVKNAVTGAEWGRSQRPEEIWILPKPQTRDPKINSEKIDNTRISKAYREAVKAFNDSSPSLVISACGRIVEAIGKIKFPNSKGITNIGALFNNLRKELKAVPAFKEILMPFIDLGEALRLGRNPGSHFDLETDPTLELAGKVLDLTEFLLEYIYVISGESINVDELIKACGPGDEDESGNKKSEPLAAGQIPAPPMTEVVVDSENGRAGTAP
jgi:hypothetical protein